MTARRGTARARRGRIDPRAVVTLCGLFLLILALGAQILIGPGALDAVEADDATTVATPDVLRVRLTGLDGRPLHFSGEGGLVLTSADGRERTAGDALVIAVREGVLTANDEPVDDGVRVAARDGALRLDDETLPGVMRIHLDERAGSIAVLELPVEDYVAGVLPSEMPMSWPESALAAQAIAARSYALATALRRARARWDVVDTEASQVFRAGDVGSRRARRIVAASKGLVLTFEDRVLPAYFGSACGGHTRGNDVAFGERALAPLAGVACDHCSWSSDHHWTRTFDVAALATGLGREAPIVAAHVDDVPQHEDGVVTLRDANGAATRIGARTLRRALGTRVVRSTHLTGIAIEGAEGRISGRGFGHRVGLCQTGARALAEAGHDPEAILAYYYPGARLRRVDR